jgi:hypothetical protein
VGVHGFPEVGNFYRFTPIQETSDFYHFISISVVNFYALLPQQKNFRSARCARRSHTHEAAAMRAVDKDLMAMKVDELKEELAARDEATSGNKSWRLRRRLHAAILR